MSIIVCSYDDPNLTLTYFAARSNFVTGFSLGKNRGRTGAVVSAADYGPMVPGSRPDRVAVRCGLEEVTFTPCLVLVKPRKPWTYD